MGLTLDQKIERVKKWLGRFKVPPNDNDIEAVVQQIQQDSKENKDRPVSYYVSPHVIPLIEQFIPPDGWYSRELRGKNWLRTVFVGAFSGDLTEEALAILKEKMNRLNLIDYLTIPDYECGALTQAAADGGNLSGLKELNKLYKIFKESEEPEESEYFLVCLGRVHIGLVVALKEMRKIESEAQKDCFKFLLYMCKEQALGDSQSLSGKEMHYQDAKKPLLWIYADICKEHFKEDSDSVEKFNTITEFVYEHGTQDEFNQFYNSLVKMLKAEEYGYEKHKKCWGILKEAKNNSDSDPDRKPINKGYEEVKNEKIELLTKGIVEGEINFEEAKKQLDELCRDYGYDAPGPILEAARKAFNEAVLLVKGKHVSNKNKGDLKKSLDLAIDVMLDSRSEDKIKALEKHALQEASGKPVAWKKFTGALMFLAGVALIVLGLTGAIPTGGASLTAVYAGASLSVGGAALLFHGRQKGFSKALSNAADISKQQINKLNKT